MENGSTIAETHPANAVSHCLNLMNILEQEKRLDFQNPPEDSSPLLSTSPLFGETRGQMFGMLVCRTDRKSSTYIILKAFSGQFNGIWNIEGWSPPLLDEAVFAEAVKHADPEIKKLTAEINRLKPETDPGVRSSLIERRRQLSQTHMRKIHEMYIIRNFLGESTSLPELFGTGKGNTARIPAGTGDCCAPKLLNHAVLLGLQPVSIAEFYWGRKNRSGTKQHRCFYPPCTDKCMPILGYMLKGTDGRLFDYAEGASDAD